MTTKRFLVSGRVQGVFFRASTKREAERLGLNGSAVNLPDGRVEVLASGSASSIKQLGAWLRKGPPAARVIAVQEYDLEEAEAPAAEGFSCG
jgi:acylphosphatase